MSHAYLEIWPSVHNFCSPSRYLENTPNHKQNLLKSILELNSYSPTLFSRDYHLVRILNQFKIQLLFVNRVSNWITENGICTAPDHCACEIGWEGALCNVCVRLPGCLNGDCTEALECNCHEGWTGGYCDMRKQLIIYIFHDVVIIKIEFQNHQVWFVFCSF